MKKKVYDNSIYFLISTGLKGELTKYALKNEQSAGEVIRQAIRNYIKPVKKSPKKKISA